MGFPLYKGQGKWAPVDQQIKIPLPILKKIASAAIRVWHSLPSNDSRPQPWSAVKQGADETYADFVARLIDVVEKSVADAGAIDKILKQLAYENANRTCQALLNLKESDGR